MATPPILAIDDLLEPIPGDDPSGESVPFTVRQQLEEYRKEINPNDYAADDPRRPDEYKRADWPGIIDLAQSTLKESSKDLLVSARLTEALTKEKGFPGLRDGLHLMRRLVSDCWDRIRPDIDDGDLEVRAAPFNWLDDPDRGARFPTTVRRIPLVQLEEQTISWFDWKQLQEGKGEFSTDDFEKAVMFTPREQCQRTVEDIDEVKEAFSELTSVLEDQLGELAPSLLEVRYAITDCENLAKQILQRKGPGEEEPQEDEEAAGAADISYDEAEVVPRVEAKPAKKTRTRDDIYNALNDAALMLQKMEPHSPIPYLIQRAIELGAMPFPDLMRALIRDENVISEMNRELGIKEQSTEETE